MRTLRASEPDLTMRALTWAVWMKGTDTVARVAMTTSNSIRVNPRPASFFMVMYDCMFMYVRINASRAKMLGYVCMVMGKHAWFLLALVAAPASKTRNVGWGCGRGKD
jgi:hypothetical protein